jgi:tyrosine phenol-lyase
LRRHAGRTFRQLEKPKMLRFFFGKLPTTTDWQRKLLAKFKADLGSNL